MKIRAVRLAECGRFATPVALEGLSGRLDILAEPNEFGKSTLLKAVRLALTEKHTSSAKHVTSLQPYGGGAPLIEIDFDVGNAQWRLRKQFIAQRRAELTGLDGGGTLRGEEAESRLAELLGGDDGKGQFPLLWVAQGQALAPLAVDGKARPLLDLAIAQEMQTLAGGSDTRRIAEIVRGRLLELLTNTGRPKVRGRYDLALKAVEALTIQRDETNRKVAAARAQRDRLAELREREAMLRHPEYRQKLDARFEAATRALAEASEAEKHLGAARTARQHGQNAVAAARAALDRFERDVATLSRARDELASVAETHHSVTAHLVDARARAGEAQTAAEALKEETAAAERSVEISRRRARASEIGQQHAAVALRLAEARSLDADRARLLREAAENRATDGLLDAARGDSASIAQLAAQISASAATVSIAYVPGATGRLRLGGTALADGARHEISAPSVIEIEGIGRLTIVPGGAGDLDDMRKDLEAHRATLAQRLSQAGCDSIEALAAAVARRRAVTGQAAEISARLAGLAPQGLDELEAEVQRFARALAELPPDDATAPRATLADSEARLAVLRTRLASATEAALSAHAGVQRLERDEARSDAQSGSLRHRVDELSRLLPPEADRETRRTELAAALDTAQATLDAAERQVAVWTPLAPDEAGLAVLKRSEAEASSALREWERELIRLERDVAEIDGGLRAAGNDDAESLACALDERLADARDDLLRVEDEVAALQMLDREVKAIEEDVRDRYLAPVVQRLRPYLDEVFPGGTLAFSGALAPEHLTRGGKTETLDRLSDGTREQIAVLGRLAFARLLADSGHAVPLVLDDALVYADDTRLAAMFRALELASAAHQVIVLTCRDRSFDGLGGQRVRLTPWHMTRA